MFNIILASFLCTGHATEARRHVAIFANVVSALAGLFNVYSGAIQAISSEACVGIVIAQ